MVYIIEFFKEQFGDHIVEYVIGLLINVYIQIKGLKYIFQLLKVDA